MTDPHALVAATLARYVAPGARVIAAEPAPMAGYERGYSGAALLRWRVRFARADGAIAATTLVTKEAPLVERLTLATLADRGHDCLPFCHVADLTTDAPALVCLQDVPGDLPPAPPGTAGRVARGLAAIHAANLGAAARLPWLPRADGAHFADTVVGRYWRAHWRRELANDERFAREFGPLTAALEGAAARFLRAMGQLWDEGDSLTLAHADMSPSGTERLTGHVTIHRGRPYFLDWGQARYGSFYLDLPNYFTPAAALGHRDALAALGRDIPAADFLERYREAGRYPGFKYLSFGVSLWQAGGRTDESAHLLRPMLALALHGAGGDAAA